MGTHGSPKGLQVADISGVSLPVLPISGTVTCWRNASQSFQRQILPGRHEHISASKKQIRIKVSFLCLVLFKEANVPVGEAVPGALPAWKVGKPPAPGGDLPGTTPASAHERQEPKADIISKGFASIQ